MLEQYGVEVELSPLQKTVLTYLLRHPFGVYARWMENDEDELMEIYGSYSVSESQSSDKAVISALVSPNGGERKMSEQVSRIKAAFTEDDVIWDLAY